MKPLAPKLLAIHAPVARHTFCSRRGTAFASEAWLLRKGNPEGKEVIANGGSTEIDGFLQPGRGG